MSGLSEIADNLDTDCLLILIDVAQVPDEHRTKRRLLTLAPLNPTGRLLLMEQLGLLTRRPAPGGRYTVTITPKGTEAVKTLLQQFRSAHPIETALPAAA